MRNNFIKTEIGFFPTDWPLRPLKAISPSQSVGLVINPSSYYDPNGEVPILVGSNVSENKIDWESANRISHLSNAKLPASRLKTGDLVTVRVGDPGITAVVPEELDGCNCASMMIIRHSKSFDSLWLSYIMNSAIGIHQIRGVQYGTAQKQFNISDAINFKYPVPPLPEQRAIAQALSDVDELINSLDKLIAKKRAIKQATMQQLLTGKMRLPGFSEDWVVKSINEIVTLRKDKIDPKRSTTYTECVELENISQGTSQLLGMEPLAGKASIKSVFKNGDVLFGKLRSYLRKHLLCDKDGVCSTEIWVLVANRTLINPEFLFHIVTSDSFIDASSTTHGTHMPRSDWNVVKEFQIKLPDLAEQTNIAKCLSSIDDEISSLVNWRSKTTQIKQAMMQELLTGKTRLI